MLTSMQFTLQDLFWDYLALELTLDSIYYSGATELSGWWTYGFTWNLLDYLMGLATSSWNLGLQIIIRFLSSD